VTNLPGYLHTTDDDLEFFKFENPDDPRRVIRLIEHCERVRGHNSYHEPEREPSPVFEGVKEKRRLMILEYLEGQEDYVSTIELASCCNISSALARLTLKPLKFAGYITCVKKGNYQYWKLKEQSQDADEIRGHNDNLSDSTGD